MKLTTPEISWHGKEPLFSVDFSLYSETTRLATCGADFNIRIWSVFTDNKGDSKVEFIANLSRHTKAVNVVRFSSQGNVLASGGDDCFVIIWKLNDNPEIEGSQLGGLNSEDVESKESWQVVKMLRGHVEDVYDLAWSPSGSQLISGSVDNSVIIWDAVKGDKVKLLKDHRQYVQGVCWDPCGTYVASYSSDRTCRIYTTSNYRCCYNVNKITLPNKTEDGRQNLKQMKLFHDETMPSFFRRLTFSPDGSLLLVPGGRFEVNEQTINTTFVFTKASMNKPVMYFPASKKPTIAVRCCPVLFEHHNTEENSSEKKNLSVFKLPYRMIIAVASLDCVVLYDTQQTCPFAFLSNMHYATLTDITWSNDGRILAVSSSDGYCSLVTFEKGELGIPYGQTAREVIGKATAVTAAAKESSPSRRNALTLKTPGTTVPTKEPVKEKDITVPKMESLSIKKFVIVSSTKPSSTTTVKTTPPTNSTTLRRIPFVTVKPAAPVSLISNPNINPASTALCGRSIPTAIPPTNSTSPPTNSTSPPTNSTSPPTNPRRIPFVTLKPTAPLSLISKPNVNPTPIPPTNSTIPPTTIPPRRIPFVTINPTAPLSVISNPNVNPANTALCGSDSSSNEKGIIQPASRQVGFVTLQPSQSQNLSLLRQEKPPIPLEPEIIIID